MSVFSKWQPWKFLWHRGLRICFYCSGGAGCNCGLGSTPGLGISTCHERGPKKNSQGGSPVCWWYPCWGTWISCHPPPRSASFLVEGCCWGNSLPRTCVLMHSRAKESCPAERGKGWQLEVGLETLQESRPRGGGTSSCLLQPALASGNLNLLKSWY